MSYVDRIPQPPKTLTTLEQEQLLRVTGQHKDGFRDHCLFSMALGTALREHELVALNIGNIYREGGAVRRHVELQVYKRSNQDPAGQGVLLPDRLQYKLEKLWHWKRSRGELLEIDAPLFISRFRRRLSTRMVRHAFGQWCRAAGFERHLTFHALRHSALSNLYQATKDIRLVQRAARHKSVITTQIYAQAGDQAYLDAMRAQPC